MLPILSSNVPLYRLIVRAGDSNKLIPQWLKKGKASIGWDEPGSPRCLRNRDELVEESHKVYADFRPQGRIMGGSQVWKIVNVIKTNNRIVTYARHTRDLLSPEAKRSLGGASTVIWGRSISILRRCRNWLSVFCKQWAIR